MLLHTQNYYAMIIYPTLEHLSNGEIKTKLNEAPALMTSPSEHIVKQVIAADNNYETRVIILQLMFDSGKWESFLSQNKTEIDIKKYIRNIKRDEKALVNGLNQLTLVLKRLYIDEEPSVFENTVREWELFFLVAEQIALQEWEYNFKENVFYPVIETWLNTIKGLYSGSDLALRKSILPDTLITNKTTKSLINQASTIIMLKPFADYLMHLRKEELARQLREQFRGEKGKGLKMMVEVLSRNEPPLISFMYGQASALHTAIETYFDCNIGKYSGFNDYKIKPANDKDITAAIIKLDQALSLLN